MGGAHSGDCAIAATGRRPPVYGFNRLAVEGSNRRLEAAVQSSQVVSSFCNGAKGAVPFRNRPQAFEHAAVARCAHPHGCKRVIRVCVVASGYDRQGRLEAIEYWKNDGLVHQCKICVVRSRLEWHIQREAFRITGSDLIDRASAGVKRELVSGNVEHARFVIERVLSAVAVVHVNVDDGHSFEAAGERGGGSDGSIVVKAKTHCTTTFGVVPRRPHQREGGLAELDGVLGGLDGRAGSNSSCLGRLGGYKRIGIEGRSPPRGTLDTTDVLFRVNSEEFVRRRRTTGRNAATLLHVPRGDRGEHIRPFDAFRVPGRRHVV